VNRLPKRGGGFAVKRAEGSAKFLQQRRQQNPPLGKFLPGQKRGKQPFEESVVVEPPEISVVGLETEKFLQDGQAKNFAVVHLRSGAAAGQELSVAAGDPGFGERIVESAVNGGDEVFELERSGSGHETPPRSGIAPPSKTHVVTKPLKL